MIESCLIFFGHYRWFDCQGDNNIDEQNRFKDDAKTTFPMQSGVSIA